MTRWPALAAALVAGAILAPAPAGATDGALYPQGASSWAVSGQFAGTVLPGPVWRITAPALSPASAINHWEMNWGCPTPGSEVAAVQFGALRTAAASSLEIRVTGDRRVLWSEGDVGMPQSPAGGRGYDVRLPGGQCNVHLALSQVEQRPQHARAYFIDNPRILVRDVSPPSVVLRGVSSGWLDGSAPLGVYWAAGDNFGADGMGQQRVVVGGRVLWAGAPGQGEHGLALPLSAVPDGVQRVEVQVDGDGTGTGVAGADIALDRGAPLVRDLSATALDTPGSVRLGWRVSDPLSGVASSQVEVNVAADGSQTGAWKVVTGAAGAGLHGTTVGDLGVPDGVHAWRVRAVDVAGNAIHVPGPAGIVVDTTPPALALHPLADGWVNRAEIDLTASDNLHGILGLGAVEVDVNAAADGSDAGEWIRRATVPGAAGRRTIPVELRGLAEGRHAVRVRVRNGGAVGARLVAEARGSLRVDLTSPVIASASFAGGGGAPLVATWVADDAASGVATATVQWRQGSAWRTLARETARNGTGRLQIDGSALPGGDRALRVVVADAAGNTAARTGEVVVAGRAASDARDRARSGRLTLAVPGAHRERRGGRVVLVRRVDAGQRVRITGHLRDVSSQGIAGVEVQARGHRGTILARGLTRAGGAFALEARPTAGGPVRVGLLGDRGLLPERTAVDLRLEVRPRVSIAASRALAQAGGQVIFSGRVAPAPRTLRIGAAKGVVLEWRDPVRHTWRPVVNARLRPDGTFTIPWTFGVAGLTIPFRAAVPAEVGWPLLGARSRVIDVRVGG